VLGSNERDTGFTPTNVSPSAPTTHFVAMRDTLLSLVATRDGLLHQGVPMHALRELNELVQRLMDLLRSRHELCACHPECLDESFAPSEDEDDD